MPDNKPATIQGAVEKSRGTASDGKPALAVVLREAIDKQRVNLAAALPGNVDADRYARLVITAVKATPGLIDCFTTDQGQASMMLAVHQLAAVGLEPNTPLGDAWLLPRKNKGITEAQHMLSYRGLMKLAMRSARVASLRANVVHAGDEFDWELGLVQRLVHRPNPDHDEDELTHAYAVVEYPNGGSDFVVLTRRQVEKRRASSDSWRSEGARPYSPWTKFPEEMWMKSAMRALLTHSGLLEAEVKGAIAYDERTLTVNDERIVPAEHRADDDLDAIEAGTIDEP